MHIPFPTILGWTWTSTMSLLAQHQLLSSLTLSRLNGIFPWRAKAVKAINLCTWFLEGHVRLPHTGVTFKHPHTFTQFTQIPCQSNRAGRTFSGCFVWLSAGGTVFFHPQWLSLLRPSLKCIRTRDMDQTPGVWFNCKSKAFMNLIYEESLFIFKEKEQKFLWMEMLQAAILVLLLLHSFLSPIDR